AALDGCGPGWSRDRAGPGGRCLFLESARRLNLLWHNASMPGQLFLHDDKVALRPLEDGDAARLCGWVNDQAVLLYLGIPGRLTEGQELEWITAMRGSQRDVVLGIVDLSDGALVGTVGLHMINRSDSNA